MPLNAHNKDLTMTPTLTAEQIDRLARKSAGRKMGWYLHALLFITVNTGLAILSGYTERHFAVASAFGWGLGLLMHAAVVFLFPQGGNLGTGKQ
jgi:hypothetical protein